MFKSLLAVLLLAAPAGAAPWARIDYLNGGGTWTRRVAVTAACDKETHGAAQTIAVGTGAGQINLAGAEARSLRVLDEDGHELLYGLTAPDGTPRRSGPVENGDVLALPVDCAAGAKQTLWVYFGNERAGALPDFLAGGFANGGFERGDGAPAAWQAEGEDEQHTLAWGEGGAHTGRRSAKAEVTAGAEKTWFKFGQSGLPVVPGEAYELRAWVRGESVAGTAGWYIHVNGERPQMINQVLQGGEGTFDWKEVVYRFIAPAGAATANVGTVLYGTGRAWFDDASLRQMGAHPAAKLEAGPVETRDLATAAPRPDWRVPAKVRLPLRVPNFDEARPGALVGADLRRAFVVSRLGAGPIRVFNAATGQEAAALVDKDRLLFQADLPARSLTPFDVYLGAPGGKALGRAALTEGPSNLVQNADFESGGDLPDGWTLSAQNPDGTATAATITGRRVPGGKTGKFAVELSIPPGATPAWSGWHQSVPVVPGGTYQVGGWLKTKDVDSGINLHIHLIDADKKLTTTSAFLGAQPQLNGTTDWTWVETTFTTPSDARFLELHLTSNAHGTVWHDGILVRRLADTVPALARDLEAPLAGLQIWQATPDVKIFRDDPPGAPLREVNVALARNEREPVQMVLKSATPWRGVQVTVGELRGAGGALPPVEINRVAYVPVDYPTNYYSINVPAWQRKIPTGTPSSDGWPGEWPDPLPPASTFDLAPQQAQPVWLTVAAPENAAPGVYRGQITLRATDEKGGAVQRVFPLTVTVHRFALPKSPSLNIIFDGRGGMGEAWYRFMAAHHASPGYLPEPRFSLDNGQVKVDFTEFDRAAALCFDELGMSAMYTPQSFYALGWAYSPKKFLGWEAFTSEWENAFGQALRQYAAHLKQKGWFDKITFYLSDEPFGDRPEVIQNLSRFSQFVQKNAPGMPIYSSTWGHFPGLNGAVTRWGAAHYGKFPVERLRERQAAGDSFWFTTDGQQCLDTPYVGTERLLSWYCFKYDVRGFEFWGANWYTYDPWQFGWHSFIQQANSEKEAPYWTRYPDGDGYIAYPGKAVGVTGPISSLRFEAVRDGAEDYEYLLLLRARITSAKAVGKDTKAAAAVLNRALDLVSIPNAGGLKTTETVTTPGAALELREAIARQIEALGP